MDGHLALFRMTGNRMNLVSSVIFSRNSQSWIYSARIWTLLLIPKLPQRFLIFSPPRNHDHLHAQKHLAVQKNF
jgi:hypothetical protein